MRKLLLATPLIAILAACATTPQTVTPSLDLPSSSASVEDLSQWWRRFGDERLTVLVERALVSNADLKQAVARVDESAALLRVSRSDLFPSVDATAGGARSRASETGAMPRPGGTPQITNNFSAAIEIAYEVDLWGRVRSANSAALAEMLATQEALNAARSAIAAQVARAYFNLLALDRKLALTQQTLATRDDVVRLQRRRFEAGASAELELQQAFAEREAVAAIVPSLIAAQSQTERALKVLVGESPRNVVEGGIDRVAVLPTPPQVPAGLPSDLLERRADIRQAQAQILAADAQVAQARARYYPSIILTGSIGRESAELVELFSGPSAIWRLAASLTQPIFGIRQINARVDAAEASRLQAEAAYVGAVQQAFKEVHDALGSLRAASDVLTAQERRTQALRETARIADLRFAGGVSPFLEVLDAQRSLLNLQIDQIDTQSQRLNATVDVFRALGGGWPRTSNTALAQ